MNATEAAATLVPRAILAADVVDRTLPAPPVSTLPEAEPLFSRMRRKV